MQQQIKLVKEKITEIKEKRKKYLTNRFDDLEKIEFKSEHIKYSGYSRYSSYTYSKMFLMLLRDTVGLSKKEIKMLKKIRNIKGYKKISISNLINLNQKEWDFVVKLIENIFKHENEFKKIKNMKKLSKEKMELYRLSKYYNDMRGEDLVEKICEICKNECQIKAIFCQICGNKF